MIKRDQRIVDLYRHGHSMREIASRVELSLARVREIIARDAPQLIRKIGDTRNNSTGKPSRRNR